ncbi:MAG: electron transport complex subunit E [Zoogloeaceae bacterium]|jgi:electron transport complex protein RnfE|nr:electron transport complex subunit E [Zoogloeaceae bacterium]
MTSATATDIADLPETAADEAAPATPVKTSNFKKLAYNGLWKENASLSQLLGLCPLLAVSTSIVNSFMLSVATVVVVLMSNLVVSLMRNWIPREIRIPIFILLIAALVTIVDLLFNAFFHSLYVILGIFIPLITTNCVVLARVEAFAAKNSAWDSSLDGLFMGLGLTWVLVLLGALREFVGSGTLLEGIDMVIPGASAIHVLPASYPGFTLALLPPGAFIFLGLMIAAKNWLDQRPAKS